MIACATVTFACLVTVPLAEGPAVADDPPYSETGGATGTHFYNPTGVSFDESRTPLSVTAA